MDKELYKKIKQKKEIWRPVKGYERLYEVSNVGRVYSVRTKSIMEPTIRIPSIKSRILNKKTTSCYFKVGLTKNGTCKNFQIHRLVAAAFLENPDNKPYVNHLNEVKTDNRVQNLQWCTNSENMLHSIQKRKEEKLKIEKVMREIDGQLLLNLNS